MTTNGIPPTLFGRGRAARGNRGSYLNRLLRGGGGPRKIPLDHVTGDRFYSSDDDEELGDVPRPSTDEVNSITNGKDGGRTELSKHSASTESVEVGMECGLKNLYSGKEDKRGRFQWQDEIPDDIGRPCEDAESAKWALLVRNVKVYNDPRKVLAMHSIIVQSPLLKRLLGSVLKDYPGITVGLQRLEFSGKFEPLIHRWSELKAAIAAIDQSTEVGRTTKDHADLLYNLLQSEFRDMIDSSQDMQSKQVMTYEYLWTLFQPGMIVYARQDGQETATKLHEVKYGTDNNLNPCLWLSCKYIDWDGHKFGTNKINMKIACYNGTRAIKQLPVIPLLYHPDKDALINRLLERASRAECLAGSHYKAYQGLAWRRDNFGGKDRYHIKGRIVIDTFGWNRFNPNHAIYTTPLNQKGSINSLSSSNQCGGDPDVAYSDEDDCDMPIDGAFGDQDEESPRPALTEEQKLILTPLLRGYSLKDKLWLHFFVDGVKEIEWSAGAFDSLVLPANQKELILGFTQSQQKFQQSFDDVIEGKGKGIILLLCGPPGVGKTLTAESVAEEMHVPLYMMSAGDLGLDPRHVESKLQNILEMCTKWNAILLLDEADIFLEQRSLHELERNKLVSIFLRILEYFEGIMFLTTNRVQTFDPAFQSRIHISIDYPELSSDSRRMIWTNFLKASQQKHAITERNLDQLELLNLNGRQIKNVLKTAQLLASRKEVALQYGHIVTVLDVTQHLHNANQENERARSSIFC